MRRSTMGSSWTSSSTISLTSSSPRTRSSARDSCPAGPEVRHHRHHLRKRGLLRRHADEDEGLLLLGLSACWNMVVLVLFALEPNFWISLAIVIALAAAMFTPLKFIHPVRTDRWRMVTLPIALAWTFFAGWRLWDFDPRSGRIGGFSSRASTSPAPESCSRSSTARTVKAALAPRPRRSGGPRWPLSRPSAP